MIDIKLVDAFLKVKYPEDKYVDEKTTDPEIVAFNEGWNELHRQLSMQLAETMKEAQDD